MVMFGTTYAKVLNMSKDLIVKSEVVGWDDINTSLLLNIPVLKTESLCLCEEICLGNLATPVCFSGLLQVTVDTHAWETENRSVNDAAISIPSLLVHFTQGRHLRLNHDCGLVYSQRESRKNC